MDLSWLGNANWINLVILAFIIIVGLLMASKGLISFRSKSFTIGKARDSERLIIRRQLEYVDSSVEEALTEVQRTKDWENWKAKYAAERVKDVLQSAITFNHISRDPSYVNIKQLAIWAEIQRIVEHEEYYSCDEFKVLVYNWVKQVVEDLLSIREYCMKENI